MVSQPFVWGEGSHGGEGEVRQTSGEVEERDKPRSCESGEGEWRQRGWERGSVVMRADHR